jgi:hypothetical protein
MPRIYVRSGRTAQPMRARGHPHAQPFFPIDQEVFQPGLDVFK